MSNVIRAVKSSWLPMPTDSLDVRPKMPRDTYRLSQIAIEAAQRMQQRQLDRTVRAGNINSTPAAQAVQPIRLASPSNFIINLPVR